MFIKFWEITTFEASWNVLKLIRIIVTVFEKILENRTRGTALISRL